MATIEGLRSTSIPGLRLRPFAGEADLAGLAHVHNAEAEADGLNSRTTVEELRSHVSHPSASFDGARDITIAEVDGRIVAMAMREIVDTTDGFREHRMSGEVDAAFRRRGIGSALFAENQRRHRALAAGQDDVAADPDVAAHPPTRIFGSWTSEGQAGAVALLKSNDFSVARWFFEMVRPTLDDIPDVPLPDGLELRPIDRSRAKQVWDADVEAFADHWGGFDGSDAHLQRWLENPNTDLSLWVIAFDGEEVAGGIINGIDRPQNEALGLRRGWLNSVFTRRQWRRRGLATALIAESLRALRERGMTSAALGVDAANPSGALGLYEGTGFRVEKRSNAWRRDFA
jgi:mycothiol synthase